MYIKHRYRDNNKDASDKYGKIYETIKKWSTNIFWKDSQDYKKGSELGER